MCVCVCVCGGGGGGTEGGWGGCWLGMYSIVAPELLTIFSSPPLCVCVEGGTGGGGGGGRCWLGMYNIVAPELLTISHPPPTPFVFLLSFFLLVVQGFVAVVFLFV